MASLGLWVFMTKGLLFFAAFLLWALLLALLVRELPLFVKYDSTGPWHRLLILLGFVPHPPQRTSGNLPSVACRSLVGEVMDRAYVWNFLWCWVFAFILSKGLFFLAPRAYLFMLQPAKILTSAPLVKHHRPRPPGLQPFLLARALALFVYADLAMVMLFLVIIPAAMKAVARLLKILARYATKVTIWCLRAFLQLLYLSALGLLIAAGRLVFCLLWAAELALDF